MKSQMIRKKAIISRLFAFDQRMTDFLFEPLPMPCLREHPGILLDDSWELNPEQQILVRAALDIWNGSGQVFLYELLNGLSEHYFSRLMASLVECRELEQQFDYKPTESQKCLTLG